MERRTRYHFPSLVLFAGGMVLALLSGCGGAITTETPGGGTEPTAQSARLSLRSEGTLAGRAIGGIGVSVQLPDGVTVNRDPSGSVASGVVTASGVAAGQATVMALYTDATPTARATLHVVMVSNGTGFPVGEFATVTCAVNSGSSPTASAFGVDDFQPVDMNGAVIPDLAAGLSATIE